MDDGAPLQKATDRGTLYDRDFHAWGLRQSELLRAGRFAEADIENIAEEIEGLSRSDRRELLSRLSVLLLHLLKWGYQPELRGQSWRSTVREQRRAIRGLIAESPSLRSIVGDVLAVAYVHGKEDAADESGLAAAAFPSVCPWSIDQIMDETFWPT